MHSRLNGANTRMEMQDVLLRLPRLSDRISVNDMIGKRVTINDHYHGKVVAMNESPYGAFPASHYPVLVELDVDFHGRLHQQHAFKLSDIQLIEE